MFFNDILSKHLKSEKNPINRMYLNTINIKWKKVDKAAEDLAEGTTGMKEFVEALNDFSIELLNPKYRFDRATKSGFKTSHEIFSVAYLEDLLTLLLNRHEIFNVSGIKWGYQRFCLDLSFFQKNLLNEKDSKTQFKESPRFLMLAQQIDLQFRLRGRRNFNKYQVTMPMLIFHTFRNFMEEHFIRVDYYSRLAKMSYDQCKNIVVCETIDENFYPELEDSHIDNIFLLRRQSRNGQTKDFSLDIVNSLDEKLTEYLQEEKQDKKQIIKSGMIE